VQDLSPGAEVWVESRPRIFLSGAVIDLSGRVNPNDAVSSEVVSRYIGLDGVSVAGDNGAAVWDPQGALIGVIVSAAGEPERVIPATSIASSFSSLLSSGQIRHAALGVRAVDLGTLRLDGSRGDLSVKGALLRDDKRIGKLAVAKDSAAAKAKLLAGDVILRVERDILDGTADLGEVLSEYQPGATVTLRILRNGKDMDVSVVLDSVVTSESLK
jgi:S1-C subfamily serine protease